METALRRVARWQEAWPRIADAAPRDAANRRPCYSFFYPEEEYQPHLLGVYDADFLARLIEERLANPIDPRVGMEAHRS